MTWAYKLAEVHHQPSRRAPAAPEVQVFTVDAKTDDVGESVLGAIDKAIPFPIIFEIARHRAGQPEVRTVAAHKQLGAGAPEAQRLLLDRLAARRRQSGSPCRRRSRCLRSTRRCCSR
ncbi:MAG: DUF4391 domain-containing protein [Dermatophilaceae bacterium]